MTGRHISALVTVPDAPSCNYCGTCERCIAEQRRRDRQLAEQAAERNRRDWLREILIPARYYSASYAALDPTPALLAVRRYHEARAWVRGLHARALVLCGPTGTGKTMAAAALVAELLPDIRSRQWFVIASALARALLSYETVDETMDRATRTSLLVIDDLGDLEPRGLPLIEEVLIVREAEGWPVVVTSNLTPKRLAEMFSDRVNDRLAAWGDVVECRGVSLRKRPEATTT